MIIAHESNALADNPGCTALQTSEACCNDNVLSRFCVNDTNMIQDFFSAEASPVLFARSGSAGFSLTSALSTAL
jgi:hypothetical protein